MRRVFALVLVALLAWPALAVEPSEMLKDAALEARARIIGQELRCVVCQNQSIDDVGGRGGARHAPRRARAPDRGDSDGQVFDYMSRATATNVLLKPPFKSGTLLLWLGAPMLLLIAASAILLTALRRRAIAPLPPLSRRGARAPAIIVGTVMLEFLLALLTTATAVRCWYRCCARSVPVSGRFRGRGSPSIGDQLAEIERERAAGSLSESERRGRAPGDRSAASSAAADSTKPATESSALAPPAPAGCRPHARVRISASLVAIDGELAPRSGHSRARSSAAAVPATHRPSPW